MATKPNGWDLWHISPGEAEFAYRYDYKEATHQQAQLWGQTSRAVLVMCGFYCTVQA